MIAGGKMAALESEIKLEEKHDENAEADDLEENGVEGTNPEVAKKKKKKKKKKKAGEHLPGDNSRVMARLWRLSFTPNYYFPITTVNFY